MNSSNHNPWWTFDYNFVSGASATRQPATSGRATIEVSSSPDHFSLSVIYNLHCETSGILATYFATASRLLKSVVALLTHHVFHSIFVVRFPSREGCKQINKTIKRKKTTKQNGQNNLSRNFVPYSLVWFFRYINKLS